MSSVVEKVKALLSDATPETLQEVRTHLDAQMANAGILDRDRTADDSEDVDESLTPDPKADRSTDGPSDTATDVHSEAAAAKNETAATPPSDTANHGPVTPKK